MVNELLDAVLRNDYMLNYYNYQLSLKDMIACNMNRYKYDGNVYHIHEVNNKAKVIRRSRGIALLLGYNQELLSIYDYYLYQEYAKQYTKIKKYVNDLQKSVSRHKELGNEDMVAYYTNLLDNESFKFVMNDTSKKVKGGVTTFIELNQENKHSREDISTLIRWIRGLPYCTDRFNKDKILQDTLYYNKLHLIYTSTVVDYTEVLGLKRLFEFGIDKVFETYSRQYIEKGRLNVLKSYRPELLKDNKVINEEEANQVIDNIINNYREDYLTMINFSNVENDLYDDYGDTVIYNKYGIGQTLNINKDYEDCVEELSKDKDICHIFNIDSKSDVS